MSTCVSEFPCMSIAIDCLDRRNHTAFDEFLPHFPHHHRVGNGVGHLFSEWFRQMQTTTPNTSSSMKYKFINLTIKHTKPHHNFSNQIGICSSCKRMLVCASVCASVCGCACADYKVLAYVCLYNPHTGSQLQQIDYLLNIGTSA